MRPKGTVVTDNKALRQVRRDSRLTQKAMASLVGCDQRHWRRYENGEIGVPEDLLDNLLRLASDCKIKIRDPDGLKQAIGPPGIKKALEAVESSHEEASKALQSKTSPNGLPPLPEENPAAKTLVDPFGHRGWSHEQSRTATIGELLEQGSLQDAYDIAEEAFGWSSSHFLKMCRLRSMAAAEQHLKLHPKDEDTRLLLEGNTALYLESPRTNPGAIGPSSLAPLRWFGLSNLLEERPSLPQAVEEPFKDLKRLNEKISALNQTIAGREYALAQLDVSTPRHRVQALRDAIVTLGELLEKEKSDFGARLLEFSQTLYSHSPDLYWKRLANDERDDSDELRRQDSAEWLAATLSQLMAKENV